MRLRRKLLLSATLMIAGLSLSGGGLGLFYIYYATQVAMSIVEEEAIPLLEIQRLEKNLLEIRQRLLLHTSITKEDEITAQIEEELTLLNEVLAFNIETVNKIYPRHDAEFTQYWWDFRRKQQSFSGVADEVLRLSMGGDKLRARMEMLTGQGWNAYQELTQALEILISVHRQRMDTLLRHTLTVRNQALLVLLLVMCSVAGGIFYIFYRFSTDYLVKPILSLHRYLVNLGQGRVRDAVLEYHSRDEIGLISDAARHLQTTLSTTIEQAGRIAQGDYSSPVSLLSEQDQLGHALTAMTVALRDAAERQEADNWVKNGHRELNRSLNGDPHPAQLAKQVLDFLAPYIGAQAGLFYLLTEDNEGAWRLKLFASHAHTWRKRLGNDFGLGEGLVGQAALEQKQIVVENVREDYLPIVSGTVECVPRNIVLQPLVYEGRVQGVLELGAVHEFEEQYLEFLQQTMPMIAVKLNTAQSRLRMEALLERTRDQTEALQNQAEELQTQQEELRHSNDELEARSHLLEQQKQAIEESNLNLDKIRTELESKARELERAGRYKSEFLASMSHELRTPLTSLLMLAHLLSQNQEGNLTSKQIEQLHTIHHAGTDLLNLINDVFDLSKVETGTLEVHVDVVTVVKLLAETCQRFTPVAADKGLAFHCECAAQTPPIIYTDPQRLKQILANLLSNALKFTTQGMVCLDVEVPSQEAIDKIGKPDWIVGQCIVFHVKDTGIGIPNNKQEIIFESFRQVENILSHEHGGTGLGLSVSRQLARLLGGEIHLSSIENQGSTFSLYLPTGLSDDAATPDTNTSLLEAELEPPAQPQIEVPAPPPIALPENRATQTIDSKINSQNEDFLFKDRQVLVVDDDMRTLYALTHILEARGIQVLTAKNGTKALEMLEEHANTVNLVLMDIMMPGMNGYDTMRQIRSQRQFQKLPIIALTAKTMQEDRGKCLDAGANEYLAKPLQSEKLLSLLRVWLCT